MWHSYYCPLKELQTILANTARFKTRVYSDVRQGLHRYFQGRNTRASHGVRGPALPLPILYPHDEGLSWPQPPDQAAHEGSMFSDKATVTRGETTCLTKLNMAGFDTETMSVVGNDGRSFHS